MVGFFGKLPGMGESVGRNPQDGLAASPFSTAGARQMPFGEGPAQSDMFGKLIDDPGAIAPQGPVAMNLDPVKLPKAGLFDQGGFGRNFLMYLLAGKNAPALAQMQMQMQQRDRERDFEIARQNRMLDRDDYLWRLQQQQLYRAPNGQPPAGNE